MASLACRQQMDCGGELLHLAEQKLVLRLVRFAALQLRDGMLAAAMKNNARLFCLTSNIHVVNDKAYGIHYGLTSLINYAL